MVHHVVIISSKAAILEAPLRCAADPGPPLTSDPAALPAVASLHQLAQLVLSCSQLLQALLVADVSRSRPLQQRQLVGQLGRSLSQPADGRVQVVVVLLLQPEREGSPLWTTITIIANKIDLLIEKCVCIYLLMYTHKFICIRISERSIQLLQPDQLKLMTIWLVQQ